MTVAKLHKVLGNLIDKGNGRLRVAVDKTSFRHILEPDGLVIMDVESVEGPEWIPMLDDDGGSKVNKDGSESGRSMVLLCGSNWPHIESSET